MFIHYLLQRSFDSLMKFYTVQRIVKSFLINIPFIRYIFAFVGRRDGARRIKVEKWLQDSIKLQQRYNFADFCLRKGCAYLITKRQCELLYVPHRPYSLLNMELADKDFESTELEILLALSSPNSVVFDVGANCGYISIVLAMNYPGIEIHAFEPVKSTFETLTHNIHHNRVNSEIRCNQLAISNKTGNSLMVSNLNTGNYLINQSQSVKKENIVSITAITIDEYITINNLQRIDGIKCDIEGAELSMLQGAANSIKTHHPWILLEIAPKNTLKYRYSAKMILDYLESFGYSYFVVSQDKPFLYKSTTFKDDSEKGYNFLFLHNDLIDENLHKLEPFFNGHLASLE